jgi:protocatechuate 3,4-dioxygenase alpha subunit
MDPLETRRSRPAKSNVQLPLRETASQTAGPYVHIGCLPNMAGIKGVFDRDLTSYGSTKVDETIKIRGHVIDGDGQICRDMMLEFWQGQDNGKGLWQRCATDLETGLYEVETEFLDEMRDVEGNEISPFIAVWIVARGINIGLSTRIYLSEPDNDKQFSLIDEKRRQTLIAKPLEQEGEYQFDIHLQGDHETVFFDI